MRMVLNFVNFYIIYTNNINRPEYVWKIVNENGIKFWKDTVIFKKFLARKMKHGGH